MSLLVIQYFDKKLSTMENTNTIKAQLESLFKKWIKQSEINGEAVDYKGDIIFTQDGIVEKYDKSIDAVSDWTLSKKRIMFIVKDQPTDDPDDATSWMKDKDVRDLLPTKTNFFPKLAFAFWALWNSNKGNAEIFRNPSYEFNFNEIKGLWNSAPFALIEAKKQGGDPKIDDKVLENYINLYSKFLSKEIDILNPNIIVCCGQKIYNFVINNYFTASELISLAGHNSIRIQPEKKIIILCSYHPSKIMTKENFYSGIMNHYLAYLNSDICFD